MEPPAPTPEGKTLAEAVANTALPPNADSLPTDSFVDSNGNQVTPSSELVAVNGLPDVYATVNTEGTVTQYWKKVLFGDKELYILISSDDFPLSIPRAGYSVINGRIPVKLLLLIGLPFLGILIRRRSFKA